MTTIIERDFRGFDLNLLLVFHALVLERNVTRAARRLFLGQPAVSGALKRLRAMLGDELFVRTSHGMEPTPRALELARSIDPLLLSLHQALKSKPGFDPSTAQRVFRIGLTDAMEVALMPKLMRRLTQIAPGVRVITRPADSSRVSSLLDAEEIELAVGVFPEHTARHRSRALFRWRFVCLFNPRLIKVRGEKLSLRQYLRYPHVLTSFTADLRGFIDEQLARRGLQQRRVIFSSPNFATNPFIVREMAAFATVPTFIAGAWRDRLDLAVRALPIKVPEFEASLLWPATNDGDSGLSWLISLFADSFTELSCPAG